MNRLSIGVVDGDARALDQAELYPPRYLDPASIYLTAKGVCLHPVLDRPRENPAKLGVGTLARRERPGIRPLYHEYRRGPVPLSDCLLQG